MTDEALEASADREITLLQAENDQLRAERDRYVRENSALWEYVRAVRKVVNDLAVPKR